MCIEEGIFNKTIEKMKLSRSILLKYNFTKKDEIGQKDEKKKKRKRKSKREKSMKTKEIS